MVVVPAGYDDLLERPLYGHLATTRPDGSVQVSPMWFDWDGELLAVRAYHQAAEVPAMYNAPTGCHVDLGSRQSVSLSGSARRRRAHRAR